MKYFLYNSFFVLIILFLTNCTGKNSLSSPQIYGNHDNTERDSSSAIFVQNDQNNNDTLQESSDKPILELLLDDNPQTDTTNNADSTFGGNDYTGYQDSTNYDSNNIFYGTVAVDDSATAVDDDIWRQFDLAEEYHSMGVIANREASWEEAQYYFEKALKILANMDVDTDSSLTPEATKYSEILENIISDYQVTLRSLGKLNSDVSVSVLVERFNDLSSKLGADSLHVYQNENTKVTYDIPIVMNERVKSSIIYFQTVARDAFYKYLKRSKKYTPMMKHILAEYGLPQDLIYLSLVESGFNPHAYSWARAMGLWQFISSTARLYKLKRNWWLDERKDPVKSTQAACRFLKDLYTQFGSWELAMAAYNGGPGRVNKTIKRQKTIDFWKMRLKRQTMDYVPLIMAAAIISKNPEKYGFSNIKYEKEVVWDTVVIDRCLELSVVAKALGCSEKDLKELNPELLRKYTPPDTKHYVLKIPKGTRPKFYAAYKSMPSPRETSWVRHKIRRGETISTIAARYGVSQYAIMEANNFGRRSRIYAGKSLIVPVPLDRDYTRRHKKRKSNNYKAKNSIYVVREGDTMWDIARAFGTSINDLRRNNYLGGTSRIYVGQKLKIPANATKFKNKNFKSSHSNKVYASKDNDKTSNKIKRQSSSLKSYKVKAGDTIWDIARKFGTTTSNIRRLNGLGRSSRIYPGQILKVNNSDTKYVVHKVRRGETLGAIARRYRTSIAKIRAMNNIDDPDQLRVGVKLKIFLN